MISKVRALPPTPASVELTQKLGDAFAHFLPLSTKLEPNLRGALRHVLDHPGSLVRPQIVFQMAMVYGVGEKQAKDLAIALEYFHTASLVFDDLPCMDNASERRGAPCVHLAFGESGAILAALALINRAYALTWRAVAPFEEVRQSRALDYVEQHLGIEGLLEGQSLDLHYASLRHERETTERIALGKTVSLIRLALVTPALLGGASGRELRCLERMAVYWGLSYQIVDDLKDVLQNSADTGKTAHRDASLDRPNIALAIGAPAAVERLHRFLGFGARTLGRLLLLKPELSFLERLRSELEKEVAWVVEAPATENVCQMPACKTA